MATTMARTRRAIICRALLLSAVAAAATTKLDVLRVADLVDAVHGGARRRLASANDLYSATEQHVAGLDDAFWTFGTDGVRVFSNDGAAQLLSLPHDDICELREACFRGACSIHNDCNFYAAATDGTHVFATKDESGGKIAIFDAVRGLYLGSYPTCARPVQMDYAPHRAELWVHCFSPDDAIGDSGHLDVFSTSAWGLDRAQVALPNQTLGGHTHGWVELDAMTPDYAWASTREHPYLARINVHTLGVETYDLAPHDCAALNVIAVSWRNKHLYVKCHVCCSCGVDADTGAECNAARASDVTLRDGTTALGYCGIACDGSAADTVGLVEFDTVSKTVVATHYWDDFGSGDPVASADGAFVVVESSSNGRVKILAVGDNGVATSDARAADVATGFSPAAHRDTLFVQDGRSYDLVIFGSTVENHVAVAHLDDVRDDAAADVEAAVVTLSDATASTASSGRLASRSMAWARGTPYVMVCGAGADELYVVDLGAHGRPVDARLLRVVANVTNSFVIHVSTPTDDGGVASGKDGDDGDDAKDAYGIAALVLATVALVLVVALGTYVVCATTTGTTPQNQDSKTDIWKEKVGDDDKTTTPAV
eukprot:CAMPEP_0185688816 /NCGR_PEP_ID=MMETSP1164-20130828/70_1 /TAXON_ID=1104430 /ORGANISM="Chrysoreinhardia sp, Strain CCMP2950" /LENGTH=597 /DNA_ID=CAMNT_0028355281 /DNA_START=25 /DNA_END=1818 /DNA_ORIENTATION=-